MSTLHVSKQWQTRAQISEVKHHFPKFQIATDAPAAHSVELRE
jgi:hypothetical protein